MLIIRVRLFLPSFHYHLHGFDPALEMGMEISCNGRKCDFVLFVRVILHNLNTVPQNSFRREETVHEFDPVRKVIALLRTLYTRTSVGSYILKVLTLPRNYSDYRRMPSTGADTALFLRSSAAAAVALRQLQLAVPADY